MSQSRREFLAGAAVLSLTSPFLGRSAFAQEAKKYKACVIGDWDNGGYGHSLHMAFSKRSDVEVVGLADPHEKARKKFSKECGAARTYSDYREMLEMEKPNLVAVGPRITTKHKEYVLACAEIGAHGYMEKPVATDLAEADSMVAAIEAKNLKWGVAHQKRATPHVAHAKKLIFEDKIVGEVLEMRGRGKEDDRAGGEDLLVLGTHIMDLMLYFVGKPKWVAADITVEGRPATKADIHDPTEPLGPVVGDNIQVTYGFENGMHGFFGTKKTVDGDGGRWGLDIYGTKGIVTIRMGAEPDIWITKTTSWAPGETAPTWERLPDAPPALPVGPELILMMNGYAVDDLLASIDENREPGVSLQKGRDALEMIHAAYEAHKAGGRIELPLKERTHPLTRWG